MRNILPIIGISVSVIVAWGCGSGRRASVVAYVSEDQVFSEPILKDFEKETSITVRAVFDTEEAKSTGVMNRLMAERNNPQADVYWANEPIRAEMLKQLGISIPYRSPSADGIPGDFKDPEGYWIGFSARARVLVVNKRLDKKPDSILAYTDPYWKSKGVIANPLFGTTTAAMAALFTVWGEERTRAFMDAMKANGVKISTSNGESADLVASGEFAFALVDSDDGVSRMRQGRSLEMVYPDQQEGGPGIFIVPNAVVMIKGGPNPETARRLIDYLVSRETERKLAYADCAQIPLHAGVDTPAEVPRIENLKTMQVDYAEVARKMKEIQPFLKAWAGY